MTDQNPEFPTPSTPEPQPEYQPPEPQVQPHGALSPDGQVYHQAPPAVDISALSRVREQVRQVFLGQDAVLDQVLAALLAGGHVLLEGKPGLGKTHLVVAIARSVGAEFGRIQFTPDLMPADVTGHTLYDMAKGEFRLRRGPVFTNLLLADEINRAPAKTQAALLEVMQEQQVTIDGESHQLESPFMTFATQNPIEQEGTYPLPEAQLDRFLMKVLIDYPDSVSENSIVTAVASAARGHGLRATDLQAVCSREDIIAAQEATGAVQAVPEVVDYAVALTRATREAGGIAMGAGTRGAIALILVAKAYATLSGRGYIVPDDVKSAALPVLRHRVALSPEMAISGHGIDDAIMAIIASVNAPRQ